jgi:hypothetical protein
MEHVGIADHAGVRIPGRSNPLPMDLEAWPDEAHRAFQSVLRELDSWCRERNRSRHNNASVAEDAVRQAWV